MAGTFIAVEHDADAGTERVLGTVTMDAAGRLAILTPAADANDRLDTIVNELNAEETMHVDAVPPPDARPFEVFSRIVPRGTDGFVPALLDHLRRYFDVELRPA